MKALNREQARVETQLGLEMFYPFSTCDVFTSLSYASALHTDHAAFPVICPLNTLKVIQFLTSA